MKKAIVLPVSQAKEGRKTSALEKSLIRFFERELEAYPPGDVAKRFFFRPISCFSRKEPPSLQCSSFKSGDDVRQLCRWHFLCPGRYI